MPAWSLALGGMVANRGPLATFVGGGVLGYVPKRSSQQRRSWFMRQSVAFDGGATRAQGGYGECRRGHWR